MKIIREEELDCEFVRKEHYDVAFSMNEFEDLKKNVEMMRTIEESIKTPKLQIWLE
jgi:hypothetical protein